MSTFSGSTVSSPMTGRNEPVVKSLGCDAASLRLSIDFGVKTISGLCSPPSECSRSRWK